MNRFASITEGSNGFPGAAARLPAECATIGQVLHDNGYSTLWVGKNHNVPEEDVSSGGSKSEWPLQKGGRMNVRREILDRHGDTRMIGDAGGRRSSSRSVLPC
jgi:arylsulfatase A-like enzyme